MKITLDTSKLYKYLPWKKQSGVGQSASAFFDYLYRNSDMISTLILTLVGFFALFGFDVLNVYNTNFTVVGGDFTVSYLGSVFYRMDEWRWPIFTHTNLAYPYGISVHGTDGSPLLSFIFKIFHKFFGLPADVQYVGIWMLICYILQAVFSVLIFRKAFKNKFLIIIGSLFFISSPIMLMRIFVHINLQCHFILLWAIYLWMDDKLTQKTWLAMGILITLATLTCPYFLPMIGGFFAILIIKKYWMDKAVKLRTIFYGLISLACVFVFWFICLGMVDKEQVLTSGGWRELGLNLTALYNPIWSQSRVFSTLTPKADFDADNYFGFGLLILLVMFFPHVKHLFKSENLKKNALISLLLAGFLIYALSSQIKFGTMVLLDYKPGPVIDWIGSVFRYSGRFFWPIWYLLAFFLIKTAVQCYPRFSRLLLPVLLLIQIWDLYPSYIGKSDFIRNSHQPSEPFQSAEWDRLNEQYQNIFIFAHNENYRDMWRWAIRHHKNVNYGFLNRPSLQTEKLINQVRESILAGYVPSNKYFYLIDPKFMKQIEENAKVNPDVKELKQYIKNIDGFNILESNAELDKKQKEYQRNYIPVKHKYWESTLIQISPHRLYRNVNDKFSDYATILDFDDTVLNLLWDKYGEEYFKKEADGRYHQVNKRIPPKDKAADQKQDDTQQNDNKQQDKPKDDQQNPPQK